MLAPVQVNGYIGNKGTGGISPEKLLICEQHDQTSHTFRAETSRTQSIAEEDSIPGGSGKLGINVYKELHSSGFWGDRADSQCLADKHSSKET